MNFIRKQPHFHKKFFYAAEYIFVFLTGAILYSITEIVYRAYTHITMFFAGGICFLLIYMCEKYLYGKKLFYRCCVYALMITTVEFIFGVIFNIVLKLNVWDYSQEPLNIMGQVCPGFVLMWMGISVPAIWLSAKIRYLFVKLSKIA